MVYIYPEKDLRAYPGAIRASEEWDSTYKIRTAGSGGHHTVDHRIACRQNPSS